MSSLNNNFCYVFFLAASVAMLEENAITKKKLSYQKAFYVGNSYNFQLLESTLLTIVCSSNL